MREIKFRQPIWENGKLKEWHYWGIQIRQGDSIVNAAYLTFKQGVTNPVESQQFTGLLDEDGNDVYEGDIMCWLKYEGTKHQTRWAVEWDKENARYIQWSPRNKSKVIGNIYEHPELLA